LFSNTIEKLSTKMLSQKSSLSEPSSSCPSSSPRSTSLSPCPSSPSPSSPSSDSSSSLTYGTPFPNFIGPLPGLAAFALEFPSLESAFLSGYFLEAAPFAPSSAESSRSSPNLYPSAYFISASSLLLASLIFLCSCFFFSIRLY